MSKSDRKTINERCIEIVTNNYISTQNEFAEIYNKKYNLSIKQPDVSRMFAKCNTVSNKDSGLYEVRVKQNSEKNSNEERAEKSLKELLSSYSYGKYSHEKGSNIMWLDVDFGLENAIGNAILDYVGPTVSILCGIGCIYIRARTVAVYEKLTVFLRDNKK